jgi:hypothetical protein
MERKKEPTFLMLAIMDSHVKMRIINLETMEGIDQTIECYGFDSIGRPSAKDDPTLKFKLSGAMIGTVNLSRVFRVGQRIYGRNEKRELVVTQELKEWDAVAFMLSRNGVSISGKEVEKQVTDLMKNGVTRIYAFKLSQLNGVTSMKDDEWIFSGRPQTDDISYDVLNETLAKIGSPWRVLTEKSRLALTKASFAKLMQK